MINQVILFLKGRQGKVGVEELAKCALKTSSELSLKMARNLVASIVMNDPRIQEVEPDYFILNDTEPEKDATLALSEATFVILDTETTGLAPPRDRVTEIAAVKWRGGQIIDEFETLIDSGAYVSAFITDLTGITNEMLKGQPTPELAWKEFDHFVKGADILVAQNMPFDWKFLRSEYKLLEQSPPRQDRICTLQLAKKLVPDLSKRSLDALASYFNLEFEARHRAMGDVKVTTQVLHHLINKAHSELNIVTTEDLLLIGKSRKAKPKWKKHKKHLF